MENESKEVLENNSDKALVSNNTIIFVFIATFIGCMSISKLFESLHSVWLEPKVLSNVLMTISIVISNIFFEFLVASLIILKITINKLNEENGTNHTLFVLLKAIVTNKPVQAKAKTKIKN